MRSRRVRLCAAVLLVCGVAIALLTAPSSQPNLSRAALQTYESQLLPLVQAGGQTVQQDVKPAVSDLSNAKVASGAIASQGDGWVRALTDVRSKIARLQGAGDLAPVTAAFVHALDQYVLASGTFRAAARATQPAERARLVTAGIALAEEADRRYDRASALLQGLRHRVGLPPDANFPDTSSRSQE